MGKEVERRRSIAQLQTELAEVLESLAYWNTMLHFGPRVETKPVTEAIDRMADLLLELKARGRPARIDLTKWRPELIHEIEIMRSWGIL